jgi:phospholipase/carboxylesterase
MTAEALDPDSGLTFARRDPAGEPAGLLVLHHGRGADEQDLLPLGAALDPHSELLLVAPRAPLRPPGSPGNHWYLVPRVGYPDPRTFDDAFRRLAALHDALWRETGLGPQQTVLGGFSMGSVMSYALGLSPERPAPAGILAFSGFIPTVEGWRAQPATRTDTRVFIGHGDADPVIDVAFAHHARELLAGAGLDVSYHETRTGHNIDPAILPAARSWLERTLGAPRSGA